MAFPTTDLLDEFNRANENPLGNGDWTCPLFSGADTISIVSQVVAPNGTGIASGYWDNTTFGPDAEAYATISTKATIGEFVFVRMTSPGGGATDGYICEIVTDAGADFFVVLRFDNDVPTLLDSPIEQEVSAGDSFGIEAIDSTLTVYYKAAAGSWTALDTRDGSAYTSAGYIGLGFDTEVNGRLDDFGGGDVVPGPITRTTGADNSTLTWETIGGSAGDLAIILFANDGGDDQSGTPGGSYPITRFDPGNVASTVEFGAYYRICTGSETGTLIANEGTFGVTGEEYSWHAFKILAANWHGTTAPECARATGETGTADPPELDPSGWGTEETIWIAAVTRDDNDGFSSLGANYVDNFGYSAGGSSGPEIASSWYTNEAASEDPGTSTHTGTAEEYIAFTIGVRPPGAAEVAKDGSDTATLSEAATIGAAVAETDSGTAAESLVLAAAITGSDTATATETGVAVQSVTGTDTASLAETVTIAVSLTATETGTLVGAGSLGVVVGGSDTGTLVDAGAATSAIPKAGTDTGTLASTVAVGVAVAGVDAGTLAESAVVAVALTASDTTTLADATSNALVDSDTAALTEATEIDEDEVAPPPPTYLVTELVMDFV